MEPDTLLRRLGASCRGSLFFLPAEEIWNNSLPGAIFYLTLGGTMFTTFYAATALLAIAGYRYHRGFPMWPATRHGTYALGIAFALFAGHMAMTSFGA